MDDQSLAEMYKESLSEKERQGYELAQELLGSTFDVLKSRGYLAWLEKQSSSKK